MRGLESGPMYVAASNRTGALKRLVLLKPSKNAKGRIYEYRKRVTEQDNPGVPGVVP